MNISKTEKDDISCGLLSCSACRADFPIENHIPRFVPAANYSGNFGFQWNRFRQTQLDSHTGLPISRARFLAESGWNPQELKGSLVLDAGCGSGRFAEVALDCGATVVAVDYSSAVEACYENLRSRPNFHIVQGDLRCLPFARESFDYLYSLGVLQHTPDPHISFAGLPQYVKPGGSLAVDIYRLSWKCLFMPKYWLRPITRRLSPRSLFRLTEALVPILLPISRLVARVPVIGDRLRYLIPVSNYEGRLPLNERQLRDWALLDTFDMLSPAFDRPRTAATLREWFEDAGLQNVEVETSYLAVARGQKPAQLDRATTVTASTQTRGGLGTFPNTPPNPATKSAAFLARESH